MSGFQSRSTSPLILPDEARAKEEVLDHVLMERMEDYVGSHTLEFKFPIDRLMSENEVVEG